jgi:hypothetical protein
MLLRDGLSAGPPLIWCLLDLFENSYEESA